MSDEGLERHSLRRPEPTQGQVGVPPLAPAPAGGLRIRCPQAGAGPAGTLTWSPPRPVG
jgi:hypothetical protein